MHQCLLEIPFWGHGRLGILDSRWMMEIIIGRRPGSHMEGFALSILFCFFCGYGPQGVTHILNPVRFFNNSLEAIISEVRHDGIIGIAAEYNNLRIFIKFFNFLASSSDLGKTTKVRCYSFWEKKKRKNYIFCIKHAESAL